MLELNPILFLYQLVGFVIFATLVTVIFKIYLAPILRQRRERIDGDMERAREALADAKTLKGKYEERMAGVAEESAAIFKRVNEEATRHREDLLEQARRQADNLRQQSEKLIAYEEARAVSQIRGELADIAVEIAGRVLEQTRTDERERALAKKFLADLEAKGTFDRKIEN
jgi:F-type H+-transporting ATPase subunit b